MQYAGIDYTASTQDLSGNRLTLTYAGTDNHPELRLDGALLAVGTATTLGSHANCTITINHPYAANSGTYQDQSVIYTPESGRNYAIIYNFGGVSETLLTKRQQQLDTYKAQGLADTTEAVLGETLHLMGMTWLKEVAQSTKLLAAIAETVPIRHHNVGMMAQEAGYYIDVKAGSGSILSRHNIDADTVGHSKIFPLIASAFEHGVLEQLTGSGNPGVSTMKLFQIANTTGRKVFLASSANYATVRPQLVNYTTAELDNFQSQVNSSRVLVLPDNGQLTLNQWRGKGYINKYISGSSMSMGMIIGGGYYGGYAATQGVVSTPTVSQNTATAQITTPTPATVNMNVSTTPPSTSRDPVDMAGGSFLVDHADLALGGVSPMGLTFSRSYTSANSMAKRTLGNGWNHNYDIHLTPTSHGEPGLGLRQPIDAASLIASLYVGYDILKAKDDITGWLASSLVSKWAVDQVIDNAMVVHLGKKSMEFVRLADGTYAAPPGITTQLIKNSDGTFSLVERFGTRIDFNANKQASRLADIDGNVLSFTYSGTNLATVQDAFGRTLTLAYDASSRVNQVTDSTGRSVSYGYNAAGDLITYTDPEAKNWSYGYDSSHRLTTITNPLAITTATNAYDTLGRVMTQTVPRQGTPSTATYSFYFSGFRNQEVDPAGNATTYFYDRKGREYAIEDALGHKVEREFDGQDHVVRATDPRTNDTSFLYDGNHNLAQTTNALGKTSHFTYDALHRLTDTADPLGHLSHNAYDSEHHLTQSTVYPASGSSVSTARTYYTNGQLQTSQDGRSVVATLTYDSLGNPATSKVGSHPAVTYTYDAIGRMTKLVDQAGAQTTFVYDKRNLPTRITDPLAKTTGFSYNNAGQLLSKTDRKNQTLHYGYSPSGKLAAITYPDNTTTAYSYDLHDRLIQRQDRLGTTAFDYDAAGRPVSLTDANGFTSSYQYDEAGNLTRLTYPDGKTVSYSYDATGRLTTVQADWLGLSATYTYDDAGRPIGLSQFNGTVASFGYDNANRLIDLQHLTGGSGNIIAAYHFTLDGNGNRIHSTQTTPLTLAQDEGRIDLSFNAKKNRLLAANDVTYTYDDEGQLASGYGNTYTFDYEHRLTGINGPTVNEQFRYDGAGNRLEVVRGGVVSRYVYDMSGNLIAEANGSNVITRYYIHGNGLLAMATPAGALYCYHFDATGHTIALTNSSKNIINKYAYTPYGLIASQVEAVPQPFKFVGQYGVMAETDGFYYMRARYYDPEVGRFISEDPTGFDGGDVNLYAYVGNNPVMLVDPMGLCGSSALNWLQEDWMWSDWYQVLVSHSTLPMPEFLP
jgi:RHS repeat-associated protein